jgi:hypothetical protein
MYSSSGTDQMTTRVTIYNPMEWSRVGRGRELQFFATDSEVRQWFHELPEHYAPYSIWGARLLQRNRDHMREAFSYPLEQWLCALVGDKTHVPSMPEQFFLRAEALIPPLPLDDVVAQHANDWASGNGLVLVQHGAARSGRRLASRIAITDKIKNRSTGEVRSLKDRAAVFDSLQMKIRSHLRYTTIQVFKDGHEEEDSVQLMTEAAAELARTGFFARMPGRLAR